MMEIDNQVNLISVQLVFIMRYFSQVIITIIDKKSHVRTVQGPKGRHFYNSTKRPLLY